MTDVEKNLSIQNVAINAVPGILQVLKKGSFFLKPIVEGIKKYGYTDTESITKHVAETLPDFLDFSKEFFYLLHSQVANSDNAYEKVIDAIANDEKTSINEKVDLSLPVLKQRDDFKLKMVGLIGSIALIGISIVSYTILKGKKIDLERAALNPKYVKCIYNPKYLKEFRKCLNTMK